jgi:hypothetical protein
MVNAKEWKGTYMYSNMHEIFCMEFPFLLYERIKRQVVINSILFPLEPILWDQATLDSLKVLDKKWTQYIDFWFSPVKEGYIIEFVIEYSDSLSEVKRKFEESPRKWNLEEIPLWIKILFMARRMIHMDPDRMGD